ncbi:hypothetical protein F5Y19DRAFT_492503 [Xylariaceae sp. FL1651]|nr:hypothetical protein F5Y19DRAFT_492503 [Xylariaceae sp. FL1651]
MQHLKMITVGLIAVPASARAIKKGRDDGTYQCSNASVNKISTIQVYSNEFWLMAAIYDARQKCVKDNAGGCNCQLL